MPVRKHSQGLGGCEDDSLVSTQEEAVCECSAGLGPGWSTKSTTGTSTSMLSTPCLILSGPYSAQTSDRWGHTPYSECDLQERTQMSLLTPLLVKFARTDGSQPMDDGGETSPS